MRETMWLVGLNTKSVTSGRNGFNPQETVQLAFL